MYGIELHRAKVCLSSQTLDSILKNVLIQDNTQQEINIGVSGTGLSVFQNGLKMNEFSWAKIVKISFKRRHFFVQLRREGVISSEILSLFYNFLSIDRPNALTICQDSICAHIAPVNRCGRVVSNSTRSSDFKLRNRTQKSFSSSSVSDQSSDIGIESHLKTQID